MFSRHPPCAPANAVSTKQSESYQSPRSSVKTSLRKSSVISPKKPRNCERNAHSAQYKKDGFFKGRFSRNLECHRCLRRVYYDVRYRWVYFFRCWRPRVWRQMFLWNPFFESGIWFCTNIGQLLLLKKCTTWRGRTKVLLSRKLKGKQTTCFRHIRVAQVFAYFIFIFYRIPFFFEDFVSYDRTYYNVNSTCSFRPASQTAEWNIAVCKCIEQRFTFICLNMCQPWKEWTYLFKSLVKLAKTNCWDYRQVLWCYCIYNSNIELRQPLPVTVDDSKYL